MSKGGPLGKYSQVVAAVLVTLIVVTKLALLVVNAFMGGGVADTPFLDNLTLMSLGAVLGAAASTAVNGQSIEAAHRRLDIIAAPPADVIETHPDRQTP